MGHSGAAVHAAQFGFEAWSDSCAAVCPACAQLENGAESLASIPPHDNHAAAHPGQRAADGRSSYCYRYGSVCCAQCFALPGGSRHPRARANASPLWDVRRRRLQPIPQSTPPMVQLQCASFFSFYPSFMFLDAPSVNFGLWSLVFGPQPLLSLKIMQRTPPLRFRYGTVASIPSTDIISTFLTCFLVGAA